MDYAGRVSAATIGYIVGNVPGAISGYYLGKKVTQNNRNMAPIKKRKRSGSTPYVTTKKRLLVKRRYSAPVYKPNMEASKVRGAPKRPRRKSVKVTSSFKRKVQKVLDSYKIKGNWMEIQTGLRRFVNSDDNIQISTELGDNFSYPLVLDAASVLWNGKTPTLDKAVTNAKNFPVRTTKIYVEDAYTVYTFRNNSRRTYHMKIFSCKSKDLTLSVTALGAWVNTMAAEAVVDGSNVALNTPSTLYADPRYYPNWNALWSAQVTTVVLEPGQSYVYRLQGPQKKLFDFPKYQQAGYVATGQKDFRNCFFTCYPDLVTTNTGSAGRYIDNDPGEDISSGIVYETKRVYKLCMPEQTGMDNPANIVNNMRKYTTGIQNWTLGQTGTVRRIDDENPVVIEQDV